LFLLHAILLRSWGLRQFKYFVLIPSTKTSFKDKCVMESHSKVDNTLNAWRLTLNHITWRTWDRNIAAHHGTDIEVLHMNYQSLKPSNHWNDPFKCMVINLNSVFGWGILVKQFIFLKNLNFFVMKCFIWMEKLKNISNASIFLKHLNFISQKIQLFYPNNKLKYKVF